MPYDWTTAQTPDGPRRELRLWPHRSLPRRGFAGFLLATWLLALIPLFAFLGTVALWLLLPYFLLAFGAMWFFLERSYADGALTEVMRFWDDRVELVRSNPRGPSQDWQANPFWVRVKMHPTGGPVENYLVLTGGPRDVELGRFLSPEERLALSDEVVRALLPQV